MPKKWPKLSQLIYNILKQKIKTWCMSANATSLHKRSNDTEINIVNRNDKSKTIHMKT